MLCRNVNRILQAGAIFLLSTPAFAAAPIEKTVLAYYDLANHKSEHHELSITNDAQKNVYTFTPIDTPSEPPTTFTISSCLSVESTNMKKGILTVTSAQTNANDTRLAIMGDFVNEHNLRGVWLHLNTDRYLFFSPETEGMMVTNTIPSMKRCH